MRSKNSAATSGRRINRELYVYDETGIHHRDDLSRDAHRAARISRNKILGDCAGLLHGYRVSALIARNGAIREGLTSASRITRGDLRSSFPMRKQPGAITSQCVIWRVMFALLARCYARNRAGRPPEGPPRTRLILRGEDFSFPGKVRNRASYASRSEKVKGFS